MAESEYPSGSGHDFLSELIGPMEEVMKDLKQKWREMQESEPLWSVIMGFVHAVDWTEPWIIAILVTQVVLLLLALTTRKRAAVQGTIFAIGTVVVYSAERLNSLGHQHWQSFAKQDYFDKRGVFMGATVCAPLLLSMAIVLLNNLWNCAQMLIQAKRMELKHKARLRAAKDKAGAAGQAEGKKEQ